MDMGYFCLLVIMNNAATMGIQIFESLLSLLSRIYPGVELLDSTVISMWDFVLRKHHAIFHSSCIILHSQQPHTGVQISPHPCGFGLPFPND